MVIWLIQPFLDCPVSLVLTQDGGSALADESFHTYDAAHAAPTCPNIGGPPQLDLCVVEAGAA